MGKYLKLFETTAEYESFIQTDYDKPNVSYCEDNNEVHYNPIEPPLPNNVIRYEASEKLAETTSSKTAGLHTNAFNTTIKSHTFEDGVGIIEFEEDVTSINKYAFYISTGLTSVTIPDSVTSICIDGNTSDGAFYGCTSLTSMTIPNSVTTIGRSAFQQCTSLTSMTIPSSVTSIGERAFSNCSGLTSIVVDSSNTVYDSRNDCNAIIVTSTNILISGCKNTIILDSVTSIGSYAFGGCRGLTSITIPNSVTSIDFWAFSNCSSLTSMTIPSSVTSIGSSAFFQCSGLTSVTIEATTPPTLGDSTFNSTNDCPIYVPAASVDVYKAAENWSTYASRIQAMQ